MDEFKQTQLDQPLSKQQADLNYYGDQGATPIITRSGEVIIEKRILKELKLGNLIIKDNNPKFRAYRMVSNQTVSTSSETKVALTGESYDIASNFDPVTNFRFVAPRSAYYFVIGKIYFAGIADGKSIGLFIYKNGIKFSSSFQHTGSANDITTDYSDIMYLEAGDYLELYASHDHGSDRDLAFGEGNTFLAAYLLTI